ncbi:Monooxygenase FAD-binding protein [Rutstroemia sp. NJR-2017a BBW]|nr:Monooxygenase FAD-binding protein [Rutstroemia sp. NJR-2017a BBW]
MSIAMSSSPKNIVIIGGSNTGLMHGVVLKNLGHNVHILEQNTQSVRADLAAGITTHPEFDEFVARHDKIPTPWSIHSPGIQFLDKNAAVKRRLNKPLQMTSWAVIYHRLRANFDGFASEFCPEPPVSSEKSTGGSALFDTGKQVTSVARVHDDDEAVEVTYRDLQNGDQEGTLRADLVILADGANSSVRTKLFPEVERKYVGYVAFRGTVPEAEVSEEAKKIFDPNLTYFAWDGGYIIPGTNGSLEPGHRRYNWVWYHPLPASSPAFTEIMTDSSGTLHRNTLPVGGMNPSAWSTYVALSSRVMCAPFAEVVRKTTQPFITAINDAACPRAVALDGKVLVAGEALNLIRPHMALSTTQSAVQALMLERVCRGEMTLKQWEKGVLKWGRLGVCKTNAIGSWFLYGFWAAAGWAVRLLGVVVGVV